MKLFPLELLPPHDPSAGPGFCYYRNMSSKSYSETALRLLKLLPRVSLDNLARNPYARPPFSIRRGQRVLSGKLGYGQKQALQRGTFSPPGYDGFTTPFYLRVPVENYYKDVFTRRQYPPLTLASLQLMVDTRALNIEEPIDVGTLCATNYYHVDPHDNHFGVNLVEEGMDCFKAKVCIEVQWASEATIAAIERNGGVIRTAYYDLLSLNCLIKPKKFFEKGEPIPKRLLPTPDCIEYYTNPKNRGYLADPEHIAIERLKLAQKYGYTLNDINKDAKSHILTARKDPRQVFFGLEPGWLVNLKDKTVYKPSDQTLAEYYKN